MDSSHVIYGLFDPETSELRYIGYTSHLKIRYASHHRLCRLKDNTHKNNWIKKLLSKRQKAEVFILEVYETAAELPRAEVELIEYYRSIGCQLTNCTDGGEGILGKKHSEETKKKMSAAATGRTVTEETKKKISDALKGKVYGKRSPESIKKR